MQVYEEEITVRRLLYCIGRVSIAVLLAVKSLERCKKKAKLSYCISGAVVVYYTRNKYIQRRCVRKGRQVRCKAKQGNGVRA